jgi:alkylation response protein AidB-like acyl-CoA dehydrogenase
MSATMNDETLIDDHQALLAEAARKYVERGYTPAARAASLASPHGFSPARWREFAEMGWLALAIPEADGGLGGSLADMCALAEELGHALVVEPLIASGVTATILLATTADATQRSRWLPALGAGNQRIAFAAWEPQSRFDASQVAARAERVDGAYRLAGTKELVVGAPGANALIVCAMVDPQAGGAAQPALFLIEDLAADGLALQSYAMVDGRHAAHLHLKGVTVGPDARLEAAPDLPGAIELALDQTTLVLCAETVGAMSHAFQTTLDYVKQRKQFGRIVAGNQALQHRLVDMHIAIEEARALVRSAAQDFDGSAARRRSPVAAAKAYVSQAARLVWEESVQMHGAIGLTDEYKLGRYVRHLATAHVYFGDFEHHLERLAATEDELHAAAWRDQGQETRSSP